MSRDRTACMMRVKNEARWIRRSLERTWRVARRVVILDDGSTDGTLLEALNSLGPSQVLASSPGVPMAAGGNIGIFDSSAGAERQIHYILSPFANADVRPEERVNEIRDKNFIWYYAKANVPFEHMLCLDGDEALSLEAIRLWPRVAEAMDAAVDFVQLPFVYVWDDEGRQRIDGIYGPATDAEGRCVHCVDAKALDLAVGCASPRHKRLRFPRAFSVQRLEPRELFDTRFSWTGTRGGFHCGSVPQESFRPGGNPPRTAFAEAPVVHFGYLDDALRRAKHAFYNYLDPGNEFEGRYAHIIGEPDQHAPGPVELAPWEDR